MNIRYIVELNEEERTRLHELTGGGHARVRRVKRAQILLAAEQGHGDAAVAAMVGVGTSTVYRTKRRFVEGGVEVALSESPRVGARRKLTGRVPSPAHSLEGRSRRPTGGSRCSKQKHSTGTREVFRSPRSRAGPRWETAQHPANTCLVGLRRSFASLHHTLDVSTRPLPS